MLLKTGGIMKLRNTLIALSIFLFSFHAALLGQEYYIEWADTLHFVLDDNAQGVAADNSNNIIMTGYCLITFPSTNFDYVTVKYDSSGTIQWIDTLDNDQRDHAYAIAVDNFNNVLVAGTSGQPYLNYDYFTVKYDSNGAVQWADTIDNGFYDIAWGVTVDNANNIIVTGESPIGGADSQDYFTVKYDPVGTIQWADTFDNGAQDWAHSVAVDNSNNIIVTGTSDIGADWDFFTVKYSPTGTILWADTIDNGDIDEAWGIAVDNSNNIIVTGISFIGDDWDYFTVKYDSAGTILWTDIIDNGGDDAAQGVAVDDSNNIIVTGESFIGDDGDYFTVRYDPDGTIQWADTIDNGDNDIAHAVAVDNANNLVITGISLIAGDYDYFTVKYHFVPGVFEDETPDFLSGLSLFDIYSNPCGSQAVIRYQVPRKSEVALRVYDASGRLVDVLVDGEVEAGYHSLRLDTKVYVSGVYFYRLAAEGKVFTKKLIVVK
jgi:uncharacterized delta-60 repeat protein